MWSRAGRIWPNDSVTVCTLCCCAVNDRAVHVSHSVFGTVEKAWGHLWVVAAPQHTILELPIVTNEEMVKHFCPRRRFEAIEPCPITQSLGPCAEPCGQRFHREPHAPPGPIRTPRFRIEMN
jgi:hypothetical protein